MRLIKSTPKGKQRVYDIEVADVHNFYANGINVHNCATNDGVSVIKDDGSVVNITGQTEPPYRITFNKSNPNEIITSGYWTRVMKIYNIPSSNVSESTQLRYYVDSEAPKLPFGGGALNFESSQTQELSVSVSGGTPANGFYKIAENLQSKLNGMTAYIRTDCNTGWMHGDIKGAWLSDTSTASVTGSNLVTNGDFTTNLNGWTLEGTTTPTLSSGGVLLTTGVADGAITQTLNAASNTYIIGWTVTSNGGGFFGLSINGSLVYDNWTTSGSYTHTGSITTIKFAHRGSSSGILDNVTVTVRGDIDRSVNNKGLQVYGTITKTAVATGSNLVAYSGFSASNYLQQPYNSSLSWGTGNFSYMVWFKTSQSGSNQRLFSHGSGGTEYITAFLDTSGFINFQGSPSNSTIAGTRNYVDGVWHQACFVRNSGTITIYVDAIQISSAGWTGNFGTANSSCYFGVDNTLVQPWGGSLALARISASVPSPTQIAKIYNDEKMLFQENSQATLYGASDAVTALAYDDTTKLLSVGTSSGRSDFQGLQRINNTTTAVTTAISASNGLIAEQ